MGSFDAARGLAETVLAAQLPDVWERAQRAAIAARGRGDDPGVDRDLLMTAAILHPIGASPVVRRTGDGRADAARFLEIRGYAPAVVALVAGRATGPTADALHRCVTDAAAPVVEPPHPPRPPDQHKSDSPGISSDQRGRVPPWTAEPTGRGHADAVAVISRDRVRRRVGGWLMEGAGPPTRQGPHTRPEPEHPRHPWWKVMCLTGVDYFSTLGYQPGIAALAAGVLSPVATLVLVLVTLFGALPVYRRVARESPHGEGSIAMLERLIPSWRGKVFVLVLLGFAATDFMITMTLSAADASAHMVSNPLVGPLLGNANVVITLVLLALLGGVFLAGFSEAVRIAVVLVGVFLLLNAVVVVDGLVRIVADPRVVTDWSALLVSRYPDPLLMVGVALIVFPKLALGLSGFETGVSVMPLVDGRPGDTEESPEGRIAGTRTLLTTAALIMSTFLVTSSVVTVLLIPEREFAPGGQANGRALAYLAHENLGNVFGTVYDLSTIAILWFAGASAMAGLLNLVPRYLPRYGMAPHWARAVRPLVLVFVVVAFAVTLIFDADVDAQGGAYATGVLVLMTSASVAVTLSARRSSSRPVFAGFAVISVVFVYTTAANIVERPEGVKIAAFFVAGILLVSLLSRTVRAFELRITDVTLDDTATAFVTECGPDPLRLVAHEPRPGERSVPARDEEYREKLEEEREDHNIPNPDRVILLEVNVTDPSEFETSMHVTGERRGPYRVLRTNAPSVPNAIAALMLHLRDVAGAPPHVYFDWTEGNPVVHFGRYLFTGAGEVAPITREILREAEPDIDRRPVVHVG